jgi:hypothetical protein
MAGRALETLPDVDEEMRFAVLLVDLGSWG